MRQETYEEVSRALAVYFGRPDPVGFERAKVPPPAPHYVSRDDRLFIRARNTLAGLTIGVRARVMQPDGNIQPWERTLVPTSDAALSQDGFELGEGYILSLSVFPDIGAPKRGQTFIQIGLVKGALALGFFPSLLVSDYLTDSDLLGWPGGIHRSSLDGRGLPRVLTGTDPAAGAEWSETVPTNRRWRPRSIVATLVTSVAAGVRAAAVILDDGATIYARYNPIGSQAASLSKNWTWSDTGQAGFASNGDRQQMISAWHELPQGHRIRTITSGLDAADNWGAPVLAVEEWLEE